MATEPTLDELLEKLSTANEAVSRAFIQQSLAFNDVRNRLREIRETHPALFTQDKDN